MDKAKVTLADVARKAGCSVSAVSFVIHRNHPISDEVRARVLAAIEELHYRPFTSRRKPRRRYIAILVGNCFYGSAALLDALSREISGRHFLSRTYLVPGGYPEAQAVMASIGSDPNVIGVINTLPYISSIDLLKHIRGIPSVIYIRNGSMLSSVTIDFREAVPQALHHLRQLGHRKIGMVYYCNAADQAVLIRIESFRNRHDSGECADIEKYFLPADHRKPEELFAELDRLYAAGVTAFIAASIEYASRVMQWAYRRHLEIPRRLSLLVFDDSNLTELFAPVPTSVQIPLRDLAELTVADLLDKIADRPETLRRQLHTRLIPGDTTGPAPDSVKSE